MDDRAAVQAIRQRMLPLETGTGSLLAQAAQARLVLIGEASHGTYEFYNVRAGITRRLIRDHGFQAVALEADWPDAHRIHRFVIGRPGDETAVQALADFQRFPRWMWRNTVTEGFVTWLRHHNESHARMHPVGLYGVDLYSLSTSRAEVIRYLDRVDPAGARRARERYACFDHYGGDEQEYGRSVAWGLRQGCEEEAVNQLTELQRRAFDYMHRDGFIAEDDFFSAEQNARLVRNAEEYYRAMFRGRVSSWNLRDSHMAETLQSLLAYLDRRHGTGRLVVWEHNSHIGDARHTAMSRQGEHNVGQLVRERFPGETFHIGFTTHSGTVTAASRWGSQADTKRVRPGLNGSWEALFHHANGDQPFILDLRDETLASALDGERLERAIGVIYRPETERLSHYFEARIARQFDAVIHIDQTEALRPLDPVADAAPEQVPETFPSGV